jgi:hypothetical protein
VQWEKGWARRDDVGDRIKCSRTLVVAVLDLQGHTKERDCDGGVRLASENYGKGLLARHGWWRRNIGSGGHRLDTLGGGSETGCGACQTGASMRGRQVQ